VFAAWKSMVGSRLKIPVTIACLRSASGVVKTSW
jgi:hypothetical protein